MNLKLSYLPLVFFPLIIIASLLPNSIIRVLLIIVFSAAGTVCQLYIFGRHRCIRPFYEKRLKKFKTSEEQLKQEFEQRFKEHTEHRNTELEEIKSDLEQINTFVSTKIKSIPVFINQLNGVVEYTEKAADELINSFFSINSEAKGQVSNINEILGGFGVAVDNSNSSFLDENRLVLTDTKKNVTNIVSIVNQMLSQLKNIIDKTISIHSIVAGIKDIAAKTKTISVNALIEAARVGDKGKGFAVVAHEVKKLSEKSTKSADQIEDMVNDLIEYCHQINDATESEFNSIQLLSNQSSLAMEKELDQIDRKIQTIHNKLGDFSKNTEDLSKNISRIVVSIQFQDITRQRIEHVIEPLNTLLHELNDKANQFQVLKNKINHIEEENISEWLSQFYTMQEEVDVLHKVLNQESS